MSEGIRQIHRSSSSHLFIIFGVRVIRQNNKEDDGNVLREEWEQVIDGLISLPKIIPLFSVDLTDWGKGR